MKKAARSRKSVLYVPAANRRALSKAGTLNCDAIIYDLEDAVAPSSKREARQALSEHLAGNIAVPAERVIRVNGAGTEWGEEDLSAAIDAKPDAILLPKVEQPDQIRAIADTLHRSGAADVRIWAMIETPLGIVNLKEIAAIAKIENGRLDCLVAGTNDLARETGVPLPEGRRFMANWLTQIVIHARAFGIDAIDGVYNDFGDREGLAAECEQGVLMGFDGKTLIHPDQVDIANTRFTPSPQAIAEAEKIVTAFDEADNADKGVISIDGRMVERLHLEIARKTLAKAGR